MIIVKEKKSVPHADVRCGNCGSLLQYGNADLCKESEIYYTDGTNIAKFSIICSVCGCKVNANWIKNKGEEVCQTKRKSELRLKSDIMKEIGLEII